jgi:hypothetical protein
MVNFDLGFEFIKKTFPIFLGNENDCKIRAKLNDKSYQLYFKAKTLDALCKINIRYFKQEISCDGLTLYDPLFPKGYWDEIKNMDNINIIDQLININKFGIYTHNSQNGIKYIDNNGPNGSRDEHRMFVNGFTTVKIAEKLYEFFTTHEDIVVIYTHYSTILNLINKDNYIDHIDYSISIPTNLSYDHISKKYTPRSVLQLGDKFPSDYGFSKEINKNPIKYAFINIIDLKYCRNTLFGKIINGLKS